MNRCYCVSSGTGCVGTTGVMMPTGNLPFPMLFEVDEGTDDGFRKNEPDPDDLTDYGYWYRYIRRS